MNSDIEAVVAAACRNWMQLEGVEGVAQGKVGHRDAVMVFVRKYTADLERIIPATFRGYPVQVQETGPIQAQGPAGAE
jgi:hypothetical protein